MSLSPHRYADADRRASTTPSAPPRQGGSDQRAARSQDHRAAGGPTRRFGRPRDRKISAHVAACATGGRQGKHPVPPAAPIAPAPEAEADQLNAKVRAALDAAEARDRQKQADYEAAQKKAADDFARQMADHDARVKAQKAEYEAKLNAQKAEYEASMAAWRARVAACKAGDPSQSADSSVPPPGAK